MLLANEILVENELMQHYTIFEKMSIISPLLHSEDQDNVKLSLTNLEKLHKDSKLICDIEVTEYIENTIGFAKDHLQLL